VLLTLANVRHLATDVTGVQRRTGARGRVGLLELVGAVHPTAAVCGTPTDAAAALIGELEGMDRGRYAGPVGWIDARGDGEFGLALRCAELSERDPASARLFAGCGIVAGSDPAAELAETQAKFAAVQAALESGPGTRARRRGAVGHDAAVAPRNPPPVVLGDRSLPPG
jgi:menaquinone-specific isochorismate synthase